MPVLGILLRTISLWRLCFPSFGNNSVSWNFYSYILNHSLSPAICALPGSGIFFVLSKFPFCPAAILPERSASWDAISPTQKAAPPDGSFPSGCAVSSFGQAFINLLWGR